jgi:hypothetical protein
MTLRRTQPALLLLMLSASFLPLTAQTPDASSSAPYAAASATGNTAGYLATPSNVMRPALASLREALEILRPERWKAAGAITSESANDIGSIERDLDTTLPPLLTSADAASDSTAQLLPAYRNVEALYDVLVRVTQTAVLAAPAQQSQALQEATATLQQSRSDFGDLLNQAAQGQERRLREAQTRLRTIEAAPPPAAPVCPPPPPVKKARPRAKRKPATHTTTAPAGTTPTAH